MKKAIVITSIFNPTKAVKLFSKKENYQVIVVGDKKTPVKWNCKGVDYLSMSLQKTMDFELASILPYNHYCRKMLGYLKAIQNGAEYIVDTDDDNIPKKNWGFPDFKNKYDYISNKEGFINIYELFTDKKIWPRGLPLNLISKKFDLEEGLEIKECKVGVWQGLADEDPDVDAVYRLTSNNPCFFNKRSPVVLGDKVISPFNTQNTIIRKELFALMYLPTYVTFRFTDILRGLVAQPIMWLYGYHLGFTHATVIQKRNPHDHMKDFLSEIPMYSHGQKIVDIVIDCISRTESIETNLYNAYSALYKHKIVSKEELRILKIWIKDLKLLNI
jgi:hypothetical protein